MNRKPLIGISCGMGQNITSTNMAHIPGQQHRLNDSYVRAVTLAGGIPVILPSGEDADLMRTMADLMDGILLSGGGDLDPNLYGKRPTAKLGEVSPRRDAAELALAEYVLNHTDKPVLGICRGIQVMNVALGGTLHIDLPSEGKLEHSLTMFPRNVTTHAVQVEENTALSRVLGSGGEHLVNSFHHQAVDVLGEGLMDSARSAGDGVIEAVEIPGFRFVIGVQWHPEELVNNDDAKALFRRFVEAAQQDGYRTKIK